LNDSANSLHLSAAVGWEIATKHRIGKLPEAAGLLQRLSTILAQTVIQPLPISLEHAVIAGSFGADHRDPFDRMIAAQADVERMTVVTNDRAFQRFSVATVW
jgi:PIN domain nuclease of toxin-antitoxin system